MAGTSLNRTSPTCRRPMCRGGRVFYAVVARLLLVAWLCATPCFAMEEVVVVRSSNATPYLQASDKVKEHLIAKGYSITVLDLSTLTASDAVRFKELAADDKTKAFVGIGANAAQWLHAHVPLAICLTYCMVTNPTEAGLTAGRPTFGVSTYVPWNVQLALMRESLPNLKRIGMLYSNKNAESRAGMEAVKQNLDAGVELVGVAIEEFETVADAIQDLIAKKPDVVWTAPDAAVYSSATVRSLLLLALRNKLPVFGFSAPFVRAGAWVGVGVEPAHQGEQCGAITAAWLQARKDKKEDEYLARTRVEHPRFQIVINQIVAKQLEKSIPDTVTKRAEIVYREN